MFERKDDVAGEELDSRLIKALAVLKMEEELSAWTVIKHHEEAFVGLKRIVHFNHKRMVYFFLELRLVSYEYFSL